MTENEIRSKMDAAFREDRKRFFVVADSLRYAPTFLDRENEIEAIRNQFRDAPSLPDYPNMDFPFVLPAWFPKVGFKSAWKKDVYIERMTETEEQRRERFAAISAARRLGESD